MGTADEPALLRVAGELGSVPAALITTAGSGAGDQMVTIRLYGSDGEPVAAGVWDTIRHMIDTDRVPIPVNELAKGKILDRRDLAVARRAAA